MSTAAPAVETPPTPWRHRHLLALEDLSRADLEIILDQARHFAEVAQRPRKKIPPLVGKLVVNLFYEPSTRTRISFSLAAKRLSAETLDFTVGTSSVSKGESFIDTARNIEAMGVDLMVVRHASSGAPLLLADHLKCGVVNAGDGAHEHPTQGLLDVFTIQQRRGRLDGLAVALVGDIAHSRVARSNIHALTKLGARVIVCGPPTLIPLEVQSLGVEIAYHLDDVLPHVDVVNLLRIQFERQRSGLFPSIHEYAALYGMNAHRLRLCRPDVLILAPGPINRGIELTPDVADGINSVILDQVANGIAVRMAVLYLLCGQTGTSV